MHLNCALLCLMVVHLAYLPLPALANSPFWKLNSLSDRDLFVLETRATMAPGICYKEVKGITADPNLRTRIISYCCEGYVRGGNGRSMKCEPVCEEDCSNGICTAPDVCECYPGYERAGGRCEEI